MLITAGPCNICGDSVAHRCFQEKGLWLVRCDTCDLHYVVPMPSTEARMTEMEAGHFAGGDVSRAALHLSQEQAAKRKLFAYVDAVTSNRPAAGPWLDIGCGTGTLMTVMRERGYQAEGIELTKDRRETAERLTGCPVYGVPVEALTGKRYAVVTMINVFSHLTDPMGALAAIRNMLLPGGILLLRTGEIVGQVQRHDAFAWDLGDHLYWLGDRTFSIITAKQGWSVVSRDREWSPAITYTRDRFLVKGRSWKRNAVKTLFARTPGAMALLRFYMLHWRERDNALYASTLIARKPA
jgi:SAM-dependent methyltransferase